MIPFGPQLIGQTEKALNALLQTVLAGRDLTEREWVALRLASQFDGTPDLDGFVAERLHAPDAGRLTAALRDRGFLTDAALTPRAAPWSPRSARTSPPSPHPCGARSRARMRRSRPGC
ncbi:hypothetical protein [Microbacterium sp. Se63.02b]|uniref:hypothetical protein n=1 Tax=Microbacterium sp. Se63.02b TaxID=2709304 RepID=UPI001604B5F4|nr:hypothetical protein [Microbacterium sp. Se63.02b]QNA93890.1 hypothetical protein G4G29_19290 [Microbacterium sp. Se63.02b]